MRVSCTVGVWVSTFFFFLPGVVCLYQLESASYAGTRAINAVSPGFCMKEEGHFLLWFGESPRCRIPVRSPGPFTPDSAGMPSIPPEFAIPVGKCCEFMTVVADRGDVKLALVVSGQPAM